VREEHTKQTSPSLSVKDCSDCSPFSFCAVAHRFTIDMESISVAPITFFSSPFYSGYYFSSKSEYLFCSPAAPFHLINTG
jgi:hypothetical protein